MAGKITFPDPVPGPPGPTNPPPGPPAPYQTKQSTTGGNENEKWGDLNVEGHCQIFRCHRRSGISSPPLPTGLRRMSAWYIEKMDINHQGGEGTHGHTEKLDIDFQTGGATHGYTEEMDIDPVCSEVESLITDVEIDMEEQSPTPEFQSALSMDTIVESGEGTSNAATENGAGRGLPEEQQAHGGNWHCRGSNSSGTAAQSEQLKLTFSNTGHGQILLEQSLHQIASSCLGRTSQASVYAKAFDEFASFIAGSVVVSAAVQLAFSGFPFGYGVLLGSAPPPTPHLWQFIMGIPLQPDCLSNASQDPHHLQVTLGTQILVIALHDADPELHHRVVIVHHHEIIGDQEQDPHLVREVLREDSLLEEMMIAEQGHPQGETKEEDQDPLTTEIEPPLVPGHLSLLEDHHPQALAVVTAPVLEAQIVVIIA
ncbi:hypothetical protein LOCC1_G006548 [Lachnellula occidentalis]|uniref:Uncharacterized protein n=1 Tax=Lachnellula occidentalis TaxID=215460 RepID=A0A8H8S4C3_9HELO|nr:hypothetical protein LOCC1_G006548 [Lachnellula occidentalis]